jgi:hypothetical protein
MPFKSASQRRKFHAMLSRGEISRATVAHWDKASRGKKLPEYVHTSKGRTAMARKKRKSSKRKAKKRSAKGWSSAKLRGYKAAKRRLIKEWDKK